MKAASLNAIELQAQPYIKACLPCSFALWNKLSPELSASDPARRAFVACLNHFRYMTVESLHFVYRNTRQQSPRPAIRGTPLEKAPLLAVGTLLPDFMAVVLMLYPIQEYLARMIFLSVMPDPAGRLSEDLLSRILDEKTYNPNIPRNAKPEKRIPEVVRRWLLQCDAALDAQGRRRPKPERHLSIWETFNASHAPRHYLTHRFRLPWWKNGPREQPPYGFERGVLTHLPKLEAATWDFLVNTGKMQEKVAKLPPEKFRSGIEHLRQEHAKAAAAANAVFGGLCDDRRVFP